MCGGTALCHADPACVRRFFAVRGTALRKKGKVDYGKASYGIEARRRTGGTLQDCGAARKRRNEQRIFGG
ncbi:hypothetical protein [Paenibacillus sp. PvR052]